MLSVCESEEDTMSRVLLVNPNTPMDRFFVQRELYPSGALLLLGSILKEAQHDVKLVHMRADRVDVARLKRIISEYKPDIVGLTVNTFQHATTLEATRMVKESFPNIKVVLGGPHISALKEKTIALFPYADILVIGEGDKVILDLAAGKLNSHKGTVSTTPLDNLNSIPFTDLSMITLSNFTGTYPPGPLPSMFIMGSRGCPFNCTFCSRAVFGKTIRRRNPEVVVEEALSLRLQGGLKEIFFHDDTFNLDREWAEKLLMLIIKKGLNKMMTFRTPCRANEKLIDIELLRLMRAANFWLIFYGVESGNQGMLDSMGKGLTVEEIKKAFKLTREADIRAEASFIVGLPGETDRTITDSIDLWREIKPDWCSFSRLIPFPGTKVAELVAAKGHLLTDNYSEYELNKTLVRTDELSREALEDYAVIIDRLMLKQKVKGMLRREPGKLLRLAWQSLKSGPSGIRRSISSLWRVVR